MIVATITEVAAEWHEDAAVKERQGAALILSSRIKAEALPGKPSSNVYREAGQDTTVGEPQAVDKVARRPTVIDHRVEI
jgi:hypothetical protein